MEKMKSLTSTTIPAARRDPQALHLRKKGVKEAKAPPPSAFGRKCHCDVHYINKVIK